MKTPSFITLRGAVAALLLCAAAGSGGPLPAASGTAEAGVPPRPHALDEIRALIKEKRAYAEAETRAMRLLSAVEEDHGSESIQAAWALDLVVEAMWRGDRASEPGARSLAERAVGIKRKIFGPGHLEEAASLRNLAIVLEETGLQEEAGPLYERILEIRRRALGARDPTVADALTDLGYFHLNTNAYEEAREAYNHALEIQREAFGPTHLEVARTLNNLAVLERHAGQYERSESLYRQALKMREDLLGPEDLGVAWTLNGLAVLLETRGAYAEARSVYERALRIRSEALGPDHLEVAWSLNNLAGLLRITGEYAEATDLLERSLSIEKSRLGPDHRDVAMTLTNMAHLLFLTGDLKRARALYEEAMEIRSRVLGPEHAEVAESFLYLASTLDEIGERAAARKHYERALAIWAGTLRKEHPDYAWGLTRLGRLLARAGEYDAADAMLSEALRIRVKSLGEGHPDVAETLTGLARLDLGRGRLHEATRSLERALGVRERALGTGHPLVAEVLCLLGTAQASLGETAKAMEASLRGESIGRSHLRLTARSLSDRQALRYAAVRQTGLDVLLTLAAGNVGAAQRRAAWDALVRSRALVLDEMAERQRLVGLSSDRESARLAEALRKSSRRLANLTVQGPGPMRAERYLEILDAARQEQERAERDLAARSLAFRTERERSEAGLEEVLRWLPADSALVAFARYMHLTAAPPAPGRSPVVPAATSGGPSPRRGELEARYLALILRSGPSTPAAVPLGPAEEIDELVARWSEEIARGAAARTATAASALRSYREAGASLRRRIWDPLQGHVAGADRVFLVPDGSLNLVSFTALPEAAAGYLIETGPLFHYLSSERDLIPRAGPSRGGRGLLAVGGPAFDAEPPPGRTRPSTAAAAGGAGAGFPAPEEAAVAHRSACGDYRRLRFGDLPAAAREAEEIAAIWGETAEGEGEAGPRPAGKQPAGAGKPGALVLTRGAASEAAFKAEAPGKRVIHLATHGFFLAGRCPSAPARSRAIQSFSPAVEADPVPLEIENPLLLSGLALAAANLRDAAGPGDEDGILTAKEIAFLDLGAVDWAVLSACDTGLGTIAASEGVLGLRRAFQVAGARTVIMSLWAVGDRPAREWMRGLYEARFRDGLETGEAVRRASLAILTRLRGSGDSTHPFQWAAFVASGDWR